MKKTLLTATAFIALCASCKPTETNRDGDTLVWKVANPKWDANAENEFSAWVEKLGTARAAGVCNLLGECLRNSKANSLFGPEDAKMDVFADCADVPMVLRSYFAFKTKRPFSIALVEGTAYGKENKATGAEINQSALTDVAKLFFVVQQRVHSGYFRTLPENEGTDTYPIDITRKSVKPGTVFYDPNGHILVVYKVDADGTVRLMDGHPDNSLTVQRFGEKFARGGRSQGGGFRNWRPYEISKTGGVVRTPNSALPDFSDTAQYQKNYTEGDYYKWVKARLGSGGKEKPLQEFDDRVKQLCIDIKDRVASVDAAVAKGIHTKDHPAQLPENIYGTDGEWESFSTPSRDARLKASYRELYNFILETSGAFGSAKFDFTGVASKAALHSYYLGIWNKYVASPACKYGYKGTNGTSYGFNVSTVAARIYDMSFDPYHCPELRWGAKPGSTEYNAAACEAGGKLGWYNNERSLRYAIDREYGSPTPLGWGPNQAQDINVPALLARLNGQNPAQQ